MAICASCNQFRIHRVFVVSEKVKDWIRKNESSDELIFSRIIKVEEFVISCDTKHFRVFRNGYVDNAVDNNPTKGNIFDSLISFLFQQEHILFIIFKQPNHLRISQRKHLFRNQFQLIKLLIRLKMTLLSFSKRLLPVNQIIRKLLKPNLLHTINMSNQQLYFFRSISKKS